MSVADHPEEPYTKSLDSRYHDQVSAILQALKGEMAAAPTFDTVRLMMQYHLAQIAEGLMDFGRARVHGFGLFRAEQRNGKIEITFQPSCKLQKLVGQHYSQRIHMEILRQKRNAAQMAEEAKPSNSMFES